MLKINKLYGLIGYPLSHSFSQKYFREKFRTENIYDADFLNFEMEDLSELRIFIKQHPLLRGFSVTIPHKERIIPFLDEIDFHAQEIGAVNAVVCSQKGNSLHLKGYNTDYYGFTNSLKPFLIGTERLCMILGNGGASKAVQYATKMLGLQSIVVSRNTVSGIPMINYGELTKDLMETVDVLVNTTPLGTWPNVDTCPDIPFHYIRNRIVAFDLVYNPERTKFLVNCENYGAIIVNGKGMLEMQADKAWEYYK